MPADSDIRWNLKLRRDVYARLQRLGDQSGVAMADIARLALVQFMNTVGDELTLEWVVSQLRVVKRQLKEEDDD